MSKDALIAEYNSVRNTIFELDKRIDNLTLYSVIATATLLGFALDNESAYLYILPLAIIIPLSYNVLGLHNQILNTGTYISVVIESKDENLNWETFLKKKRKVEKTRKRIFKRMSHYLIFDLLAVLCVCSSFGYVKSLGNDVFNLFSEVNLSSLLLFFRENSLLIILWLFAILYFAWLTNKMRNCYSAELQSKFENDINNVINPQD